MLSNLTSVISFYHVIQKFYNHFSIFSGTLRHSHVLHSHETVFFLKSDQNSKVTVKSFLCNAVYTLLVPLRPDLSDFTNDAAKHSLVYPRNKAHKHLCARIFLK